MPPTRCFAAWLSKRVIGQQILKSLTAKPPWRAVTPLEEPNYKIACWRHYFNVFIGVLLLLLLTGSELASSSFLFGLQQKRLFIVFWIALLLFL